MKALLGGKGANLAEMTQHRPAGAAGLHDHDRSLHVLLRERQEVPGRAWPSELAKAIAWMEKETGKKFGDPKNPLLVSVRSGARDSMPGMMDTILNLGLNDATTEGLASGDARTAASPGTRYRRFVQMYGDVVMGVQKRHENEHEPFDEVMDQLKNEVGAKEDTDLSEGNLQELVKRFKKLIKERTGKEFPDRSGEAARRVRSARCSARG